MFNVYDIISADLYNYSLKLNVGFKKKELFLVGLAARPLEILVYLCVKPFIKMRPTTHMAGV